MNYKRKTTKLIYQDFNNKYMDVYTLDKNDEYEHLSLITNLNEYLASFECKKCNRIFTRLKKLQRHEVACKGIIQQIEFPSGKFEVQNNIFDDI